MDLYEFETAMEATPSGGEPAPEVDPATMPEPPVEPDTPDGGEGADDPAALSRGFDETSPEFRQAVAEEAEAVVQAQLARVFNQPQFQPPIPGATPGPMGFDWTQVDPYADDFGAQLGQGIQATIQAALETSLGPVTQTLEQAQEQQILARGEEVAQDMLADVIARKGDISDRGKAQARQRAEAYMHQTAARYGETPRAAEMAIEMAYDEIAAYEQEIAQAAVAKHNNYTATLAGVPGEPGTAVAGVAGQPARPLDPGDLARKYSASA